MVGEANADFGMRSAEWGGGGGTAEGVMEWWSDGVVGDRAGGMRSAVSEDSCLAALLHSLKEIFNLDISIAQGTFQRVAVNFRMEGKNNPPAIGMLHLDVAAAPVNLHEPQTSQRRMDLPAGEQRQFHETSTTSRLLPASSLGDGSR